MRRYGLVEEGMSLGVSFEVSKTHAVPSLLSLCLMSVDQDVSSRLLLHVCLLASMFQTTVVIDFNLLET